MAIRPEQSYLLPLTSLTVLLALSAVYPGRAAPADPRLAKTEADWQARRERIGAIRYVLSGERIFPKKSQIDPSPIDEAHRYLPLEDVSVKKHRVLVLDFRRDRHRLECDDENYVFPHGQRYHVSDISVFDGAGLKVLNRQAAQERASARRGSELKADLWILEGNQKAYSGFDGFVSRVIFAHGCIPLGDDKLVYPGHLQLRPDMSRLTMHGESKYEGRSVLVLRARFDPTVNGGVEEFWIDPAQDSAVVRRLRYDRDRPLEDLAIQYQKTPHGWLPRKWEDKDFNHEGRTTSIIRVNVDELEVLDNPSDDLFDIPIRPGMIVKERTNPGDGQVLDRDQLPKADTFEANQKGQLIKVSPKTPVKFRQLWIWLFAGSLAVLLVLLVVRFLLRNRSRPSEPPNTST